MADESSVVCSIAQERHHSTAMWRNMWTLLLWLLGVSIVAFLIMAVLFLLREAWLPAARQGDTALYQVLERILSGDDLRPGQSLRRSRLKTGSGGLVQSRHFPRPRPV